MHDGGPHLKGITQGTVPDDPGVESRITHAPAAPDIPAAVGYAIIGLVGCAVIGFMAFFSGSAQSRFMTTVTLCFLVVYCAVPVILFAIQPKSMRKMTWSQFTLKGLYTRTGHLDGKEALVQMVTLPICLIAAAFAMGIVWVFGH